MLRVLACRAPDTVVWAGSWAVGSESDVDRVFLLLDVGIPYAKRLQNVRQVKTGRGVRGLDAVFASGLATRLTRS
jgi:hypothetical protein